MACALVDMDAHLRAHLAAGLDVHRPAEAGRPPLGPELLFAAIECASARVVAMLLRAGVLADTPSHEDGESGGPLHALATRIGPALYESNRVHKIARRLIEYGADVEAHDDDGATPLTLAVEQGVEASWALVIVLMEFGGAQLDVGIATREATRPDWPNWEQSLTSPVVSRATARLALHLQWRREALTTVAALLASMGLPTVLTRLILDWHSPTRPPPVCPTYAALRMID